MRINGSWARLCASAMVAVAAAFSFQIPQAAAGGVVALTFDDGPHPRLTARLLDVLRRHEVPATFYVVGWRAKTWPHLIRRMVREGHEVGNHSWRHRNLARLRPAALRAELRRADAAIHAAAGYTPVDIRPPYGALNMRVLNNEPRRFTCWSIDTRDWKTRDATAIARRALRARNGSILLFHDIVPATVRAMPAIIRKLKARGFRFVLASRLDAPCVKRSIYIARQQRRMRDIRLAGSAVSGRRMPVAPALRLSAMSQARPAAARIPALRISFAPEIFQLMAD